MSHSKPLHPHAAQVVIIFSVEPVLHHSTVSDGLDPHSSEFMSLNNTDQTEDCGNLSEQIKALLSENVKNDVAVTLSDTFIFLR